MERPCRRCVQIGRTSTCSDVPHKRRGRPRLRDATSQQQIATSVPTLAPGSPAKSAIPGSPAASVQRRGHIRTGSFNSPYMTFASPSQNTVYGPERRMGTGGMQGPQPPSIMVRSPIPGSSVSAINPWPMPTQDAFRASSATLFISIDLQIVRALNDAQNMFCAAPSAIEGRTLAELCALGNAGIMSQLLQALNADIQINRLLIRSREHRQSLFDDLRPYTNSDLFHPFPGAQEHLFSVTFVDSYNRQIPTRMVAVLGSRSNEHFAYAIVSIQRHDYAPAPVRLSTITPPSPRSYDPPYFIPTTDLDVRIQRPNTIEQSQISPTSGSFPLRHMQSPVTPHQSTFPRPGPSISATDRAAVVRGSGRPPVMSPLNTLPPLINTRIQEEAPDTAPVVGERSRARSEPEAAATPEPADQEESDRSSRRSSGKRVSMSLSEMIG